jgi:effector-binding domain-containing protein
MKRALMILGTFTLGLLFLGLAVWVGIGVYSIAGIEQPPYTVVEKRDGYEIRQYEPQLAAEVTVDGTFTAATNRGFRQLADYIFGNNSVQDTKSESIAMTSPVIEQEGDNSSAPIAMTSPVVERSSEAGKRVITFVMPSQYTMETLPRPNNEDVKIIEIPARRCAALRFSGNMDDDRAEKKKAELVALLDRDGIAHTGPPMLAQYNPPWTPPFMRRNEVLIALTPESRPAP